LIRGAYPPEAVEALKDEVIAIATNQRGVVAGVEAKPGAPPAEVLAQTVAVHFPHKVSELCRTETARDCVVEALHAALGEPLGIKLLQTMMFTKSPGSPGQGSHNDEYYIPTRDMSLVASWVALDKVDQENGGLEVIPGSHRPAVAWPHVPCDDKRFESATHVDAAVVGATESSWVPAVMEPGDALIFSGYLLHRSTANDSADRYRRAFVSHYCSSHTLVPWTNDGRFDIKGEGCLRDFLLVRGTDPYAGSMPVRDVLKPFVRDSTFHAQLAIAPGPKDDEETKRDE